MEDKNYRDFGKYDPDGDLEMEDREKEYEKEQKEIEESDKWQK